MTDNNSINNNNKKNKYKYKAKASSTNFTNKITEKQLQWSVSEKNVIQQKLYKSKLVSKLVSTRKLNFIYRNKPEK